MKGALPKWAGPVAASSVLFWLTQPPFSLAFLPFVALVPWLAWLKGAEAKEARQSGAAFGVIYGLSQMWFVVVLLKNYTGSFWIGIVPYLVIVVLCSFHFWMTTAVIHHFFSRGWWWLIPFAWTGFEVYRAFTGPFPFAWGILAHPLWSFPQLAQAAAGGTVFLVSAWCVLINLLLTWFFFPSEKEKQPSGNILFRLSTVCIAVGLFSLWRFNSPQEGTQKVVTLGQPGIDLAYTRGEERRRAVWNSGWDLTDRVLAQGGTDLLVLPEGYAPGGGLPPESPFGEKPPFSVLFGGSHKVGDKIFQGAFLYDKGKDNWMVTEKERLVPFGETLPWSDVIPYGQSLNLGFMNFNPGRHRLLEASGIKIGASVCYEGLFSDLTARFSNEGAQTLAVISIDDWYVGTPAWDVLWQSTVWRAIEAGLPVVRSGGLGRSLAADSRGRIITLVPPVERHAARVELFVPNKSDGFAWRMVFPWTCLAALIAGGLHLLWTGRKVKEHSDVKNK